MYHLKLFPTASVRLWVYLCIPIILFMSLACENSILDLLSEINPDLTYEQAKVISDDEISISFEGTVYDNIALNPSSYQIVSTDGLHTLEIKSIQKTTNFNTYIITTTKQIYEKEYQCKFLLPYANDAFNDPIYASFNFIGMDTTPPHITNISPLDNKNIQVHFNEAFKIGSIKLGNMSLTGPNSINIRSFTLTQDNQSLIYTTNDYHINGIAYQFSIHGVEDTLNNVSEEGDTQILEYIGPPGQGPTLVSAYSKDGYQIELIFDREIQEDSLYYLGNYSIQSQQNTVEVQSVLEQSLVEQDTLTLLTQEQYKDAVYTIEVFNIKDTYNNIGGGTASFVGGQGIGPQLDDYSIDNLREITLWFNEPLHSDGLDTGTNYQFDPMLTIFHIYPHYSAEGNIYGITVRTSLQEFNSNYQLDIMGLKDKNNNPADIELSFTSYNEYPAISFHPSPGEDSFPISSFDAFFSGVVYTQTTFSELKLIINGSSLYYCQGIPQGYTEWDCIISDWEPYFHLGYNTVQATVYTQGAFAGYSEVLTIQLVE